MSRNQQPESDSLLWTVLTTLLFGVLVGGFAGGWWVDRAWSRHVEWLEAQDTVRIDGRDVGSLKVCRLGCRTDADVACENFVDLIRNRGGRP